MANPINHVRLFEVNLIGDRVTKFFRRRAFQKWCMAGAFLMLMLSAVMAVRIVMNVSRAFRVNNLIRTHVQSIERDEKQLASLDSLRQEALARVKDVAPLVPIAEARVSWTAKLAALADAFPPGANLMQFHGSQGDLFGTLVSAHPSAEAQAAGAVKITFAVVYPVEAGSDTNPLALVTKLRKSKDFMSHLDRVGLDSEEQVSWQEKLVMVLRGSAEGARSH